MFLKEVNYLSQNLFVAMRWQLFITFVTPKQKKKQTEIQGYLLANLPNNLTQITQAISFNFHTKKLNGIELLHLIYALLQTNPNSLWSLQIQIISENTKDKHILPPESLPPFLNRKHSFYLSESFLIMRTHCFKFCEVLAYKHAQTPAHWFLPYDPCAEVDNNAMRFCAGTLEVFQRMLAFWIFTTSLKTDTSTQ